MNLFEETGKFEPDSLISGNKKGVLTRGITLVPGQGVLKRGTLLSRNENDLGVMFEKSDTAAVTNDGTADQETGTQLITLPSGILTDDVDTGGDPDGEPVIAEEYITGTFNPEAIIAKEGTDVKELVETLRSLGIFLEEVI